MLERPPSSIVSARPRASFPIPHVTDRTSLGSGAEFDRIRAIWRRLGDRAQGAGDDCAIVELDGVRFAISTDLAVEGTHFRIGWLAPAEIGWRVTAASLSDLAAVAATPAGVLVSVAVPREWPPEHLSDFMEGVGEAAASVGAVVWGGDLVRGERVLVDVVAVGRLEAAPVLRRGARPGDQLWVTGALGGPFMALAAWDAAREPEESARARFAHPEPRIAAGRWLREQGARAMIDISDGLLADAGHLAAASGLGWTIDVDRVPVHPAAEVPDVALASGEEYELLVALPADTDPSVAEEFRRRFELPLTRVGQADQEQGVRLMREGKRVWAPKGYEHF